MKTLIAAFFGACASLLASATLAQECASAVVGRKPVKVEYDSRPLVLGRAGSLIFERSDDGVLRALDEATGSELWNYVAPEVEAASAPLGLMTDIAVLRFDANGDGVIDAGSGDKVWLYFGLKRAGPYYYALDVTDRTPRVLWRAGADTLEGLGDAWSVPSITRVRIGGASQNGERFVLVFGGGTDTGVGTDSGTASTDTGSRIFMVDAASGQLLWSASGEPGAALVLPQMTRGFAARVAVIDTDGDEYADRMYAADVGGRVWRFDIWNGRGRDDLVTGGVFASLGAVEPLATPATASDARQFFNAPDVAFIQPRGWSAYYNLAIGSGNRADPNASGVNDRFYSLRDSAPFAKRSQADYDATTPLFDADLVDITASSQNVRVPSDAAGWKLDLTPKQGGTGEKVLAESTTVNGVVLFTTYQPGSATACDASGTNRVYVVKVEDGAAALDLNDDAQVTNDDRSKALTQDGIAGDVRIELGLPGDPDTSSPPDDWPQPENPPSGAQSGSARCLVGTEVLKQCVQIGTVLRTFWKRATIN